MHDEVLIRLSAIMSDQVVVSYNEVQAFVFVYIMRLLVIHWILDCLVQTYICMEKLVDIEDFAIDFRTTNYSFLPIMMKENQPPWLVKQQPQKKFTVVSYRSREQ